MGILPPSSLASVLAMQQQHDMAKQRAGLFEQHLGAFGGGFGSVLGMQQLRQPEVKRPESRPAKPVVHRIIDKLRTEIDEWIKL